MPNKNDEAYLVIPEEKSKESILDSENFKDEESVIDLGPDDYRIENIINADERTKLENGVEDARKLYARKHYENTNVISRISEKLGIKFKENKIDSVNESYADYQNKLNDLLVYEIEELKNGGLTGDELEKKKGDLIKYFNSGEKTNLFEEKTNVRSQIIEEKFGKAGKAAGWLMKGAEKFVNWNRKLGFKKQMGISAVLGLTGLGLVVGTSRRVLGSVGAGLGFAERDQAKYRQEKEAEAEANKEEMLIKVEAEDADKKFEKLQSLLQEELTTYESSLKEEERARNKRLLKGFAAGAGAFVMGKILTELGVTHWAGEQIKHFSDQIGLTGFLGDTKNEINLIFEKLGYGGTPDHALHINPAMDHPTPPGDAFAKTMEDINQNNEELTVSKGSSLEGTLIKHFEEQGMSPKDAGIKAHLLANAFAEKVGVPEVNLVHPGAQIHLGPDGSIEEISEDKNFGYSEKITEAGIHTAEAPEFPKPEVDTSFHATAPPEIKVDLHHNILNEAPKANIAEKLGEHIETISSGGDIHDVLDAHLKMENASVGKITQLQSVVDKTSAEISNLQKNGGSLQRIQLLRNSLTVPNLELSAEKANLEHLKELKGGFIETTNSLRKSLCNTFGVEKWSGVENMKVDEALKVHPELAGKLNEIPHTEGETLETLTRRIGYSESYNKIIK